jgi:hypothetical protein
VRGFGFRDTVNLDKVTVNCNLNLAGYELTADKVKSDHFAHQTAGHGCVFDNIVKLDDLGEATGSHGVDIASTVLLDHVGEHTGSHGVVFDNTISASAALLDSITEKTASAGVRIVSLLCHINDGGGFRLQEGAGDTDILIFTTPKAGTLHMVAWGVIVGGGAKLQLRLNDVDAGTAITATSTSPDAITGDAGVAVSAGQTVKIRCHGVAGGRAVLRGTSHYIA